MALWYPCGQRNGKNICWYQFFTLWKTLSPCFAWCVPYNRLKESLKTTIFRYFSLFRFYVDALFILGHRAAQLATNLLLYSINWLNSKHVYSILFFFPDYSHCLCRRWWNIMYHNTTKHSFVLLPCQSNCQIWRWRRLSRYPRRSFPWFSRYFRFPPRNSVFSPPLERRNKLLKSFCLV